jgi:hypothetical protein
MTRYLLDSCKRVCVQDPRLHAYVCLPLVTKPENGRTLFLLIADSCGGQLERLDAHHQLPNFMLLHVSATPFSLLSASSR